LASFRAIIDQAAPSARRDRQGHAIVTRGAGDAAPAGGGAATAPPPPAPRAAFLLWGTVALGGLGVVWGLASTVGAGRWQALLPLLLLALVAEFLTVLFFESQRQRMSLSFTIAVVMAAVALVPGAAPLVSAAAALVHVVQQRQWRRGAGRALFNVGNPALAAAAASACYTQVGLRLGGESDGWTALLTVALAVVVYQAVNIGVIAANIAAHTGTPAWRIVRDSLWSAPTAVLIGLIGGFLGVAHVALGPLGMAIFALPLLVTRFTLAHAARKNREALLTMEVAKGELEQAHAELEGAHAELEQALQQMIATVAAIIDARDQAVGGHSDRVATYAVAFGAELGLSPTALAELHTAGLLHDLGKIAVPESILLKPAKLTDEEYAIVKEHAATGERILAGMPLLGEVARMVGDHHERFDGGGYPHGQVGTAITLGGRILALADTLDSILSDRPYSRGKPLVWALGEAGRCAGGHFDPEVVAALQRVALARGPGFFETSAVQAASLSGGGRAGQASFALALAELAVQAKGGGREA